MVFLRGDLPVAYRIAEIWCVATTTATKGLKIEGGAVLDCGCNLVMIELIESPT
jgi:hypothetical protein